MKIAIPVKINKGNTPVAPLFGKVKWFAIGEDGQVNIVENPANVRHPAHSSHIH